MNKQEAIDKIEELKKYSRGALGDDWISLGIDKALNVVKQLDEPEKPVLTKEEAEWVDKLTNSNNLSDSLYYITRCGFRYPFVFVDNGKVYKLSIELKDIKNYDDLCKIKDRLIKAVIFGYEVKKEKLYTVELPNSNNSDYLMLQKDRRGKISVAWYCTDSWREDERVRLTEAEIKKDFGWAWQFAKEVEE